MIIKIAIKKGKSGLSEFWDQHYLTFSEQDSSPFCNDVISKYLKPDDYVIEIGCGNGRDGLQISRHVNFYEGIDLSEPAVRAANRRFIDAGIPTSRFSIHQEDFSLVELSKRDANRIVIYSRFSLHSDTEASENALLSKLLEHKGNELLVLVEVRTIFDKLFGVGKPLGRNEFATDHYRRFIDPEELRNKVRQNFEILDYQVSNGFAVYKNEDPIVLRITFKNKIKADE